MMFERIGKRTIAFAAAAVGLAAVTSTAPAQQIDPRVLQQVQGQLGAGASVTPSQRLDAARSDASASDARDTRASTAEELELRRQQSRNELQSLYIATPVEADFRNRTGARDLRLFGYDLFRSTEGGSSALTGSVGEGYVLGVGDELVVSFQGATNASQTAKVDREGRLIVGQLAPVRAAGRSLGAVRSELSAATRRTLLGTDVSVSVGSVRSITVFVGGEVERPGQYQLTALGDLSLALSKAGGIRRTGTLRRLRVVHANGGSTSVDLYGLLGIGAPPSIRLQDGDRIVVPVIGDTVALTGAVARPAIYELRGPLSAESLLDFAGGAIRPRGYQLTVNRIGADGRETFIRAVGAGQTVVPGDAVLVIGGSAGGASGRVSLQGYVDNAGTRPLAGARTVRELVGSAADLRPGTYMPMAVIARRGPLTSSTVYEPVDLISALADQPSVRLRDDDILYIFGQRDIEFISIPAVRRVVLGQKNPFPQCIALKRLASLVQDTQSARFTAITRGSLIVDRGGEAEVATRAGALSQSGLSVARAGERTVGDAGAEASGDVCSTTIEEDPELLPVLIENSVSVGGSVRKPGAYPVAGPVSVSTLVAVSGGLVSGSSDVQLDIVRASTTESDSPSTNSLFSTLVSPGDDLRINAARAQFEPGAILLAGEFMRPGLYSIRKGETLSQLIVRAGGTTRFAYPYGAIFTRRSVKELQQEGFRRTARELNAGLLAASTRKGDAGSLADAAALVQQLATVEAPGRVVVEADPKVLNVRPDLDTILESGDTITMPKTPNFVLALGDVSNPGALQFVAGKSPKDYIREAGGEQSSADSGRAFVVLPNGMAQPIKTSPWRGGGIAIPPGSTIIIPKNVDPLKSLDLVRDVATIFGQFVTGIASVAILATQ